MDMKRKKMRAKIKNKQEIPLFIQEHLDNYLKQLETRIMNKIQGMFQNENKEHSSNFKSSNKPIQEIAQTEVVTRKRQNDLSDSPLNSPKSLDDSFIAHNKNILHRFHTLTSSDDFIKRKQ